LFQTKDFAKRRRLTELQKGGALEAEAKTASIILAAGRGSRMKEFNGNKTLLPLVPGKSPYEGTHPILLHLLRSLPSGPKAVVIHYRKEDVMAATRGLDLTYCEQPELNGTGGALIAARAFLETQACDKMIITMGDVPLVKGDTYRALVKHLENNRLVVLGFRPESRKQYGMLAVEGEQVRKIIEWKYWKTFSEKRRQALNICNSGIYAARKADLLHYLKVLASRPHRVRKEIDGKLNELEEFFITDIVEYICEDGLPVGYVIAENEDEVMGVDDLSALLKAQEIFRAGLP
jgi:bifunctional UDP-N-acetylglucosamine pyrophosphorylase/glucosamine-1-phosphate N-acetyltransferase